MEFWIERLESSPSSYRHKGPTALSCLLENDYGIDLVAQYLMAGTNASLTKYTGTTLKEHKHHLRVVLTSTRECRPEALFVGYVNDALGENPSNSTV
jgi:hypothetical protein